MISIFFSILTLSSIWLISHLYMFSRLSLFFKKKLPFYQAFIFSLVYTVSTFILYFLNEVFKSKLIFYLKQGSYYLMGFFFILFPLLLVYEFIYLTTFILKAVLLKNIFLSLNKKKEQIGFGILILSSALFLYGIFNFESKININTIEIKTNKVTRPYTILHFSDLQFGSTGPLHVKKIKKIIEKINLEKGPIDLIANTGDHIDSANYLPKDLKPLAFKKIPTFFSLGNHEFYHNTKGILKTLSSQGFYILREENKLYKEINIIGIDDSSNSNQIQSIFKNKPHLIKKNKFNLLLYHRPQGVLDAKKVGIDLMLSGHTHGGQLIPYKWLLPFFFKYPQGITFIEKFAFHLSDGVGLWGPKIRIGTKNELTILYLLPKK